MFRKFSNNDENVLSTTFLDVQNIETQNNHNFKKYPEFECELNTQNNQTKTNILGVALLLKNSESDCSGEALAFSKKISYENNNFFLSKTLFLSSIYKNMEKKKHLIFLI